MGVQQASLRNPLTENEKEWRVEINPKKGRDSRGGKERPLMQTLLVDRRTLSTTDRDNYSRCACGERERKREGVEER